MSQTPHESVSQMSPESVGHAPAEAMSQAPYVYVGGELTVFQHATCWKRYLRQQVAPYLRGSIVEVGAGLGGTTRTLLEDTAAGDRPERWCCLEPDRSLAAQLQSWVDTKPIATPIDIIVGTLHDLSPDRRFDAVLYIDVLEHIEDDVQELRDAAAHLRPGGALVVLAPAHQWLFSPLDTALGHFRRYTSASLRDVAPRDMQLQSIRYLDCLGVLASAANRLFLGQPMPTLPQVRFWDTLLVPVSQVLDRLSAYHVGKSVLAVWTKS